MLSAVEGLPYAAKYACLDGSAALLPAVSELSDGRMTDAGCWMLDGSTLERLVGGVELGAEFDGTAPSCFWRAGWRHARR